MYIYRDDGNVVDGVDSIPEIVLTMYENQIDLFAGENDYTENQEGIDVYKHIQIHLHICMFICKRI